MADWGHLDVLVNNARHLPPGRCRCHIGMRSGIRLMAVNLTGAFLCIKHAVPAMIRGKGGAIVNVASEAGLVGIRNQVAYNVSKAGLISLTKSCAVDFASAGNPSQLRLPRHHGYTVGAGRSRDGRPTPAAARRALEQVRPANRLGTPEEIASAILYSWPATARGTPRGLSSALTAAIPPSEGDSMMSGPESRPVENREPILRMEQIDKRFPGVHALDHVDFDLLPGEVHVLLGENGAGKSTLMKVLSGSIQSDSGRISHPREDGAQSQPRVPHGGWASAWCTRS